MTPVTPAMAAPAVISSLIQTARRARVRINRLWLDRGFAAYEVVQRIKDLRLSEVIAWPVRGKTGGTRALCKGRKSYPTKQHMLGTHAGRFGTVQMAVVRGHTVRHDLPRKVGWLLTMPLLAATWRCRPSISCTAYDSESSRANGNSTGIDHARSLATLPFGCSWSPLPC